MAFRGCFGLGSWVSVCLTGTLGAELQCGEVVDPQP